MLCSSWVAGSAAFSEPEDSLEDISSAFYIQNDWAFFVNDVQFEEEGSRQRSICVMFNCALKQVVALPKRETCVILDQAGEVFVWSPARQQGPLLLSDAVHAGIVIRLPKLENIPVTKILDAREHVFALQHSARLYCSIWHVDGLSKPIYLEDVKSGGIAISPTKEWVAVCSRRELRDTISVYAVNASEPIKTPNLPQKITQLTLLSRWCVPRLSRRFPCGDIRQIRWCIEREDSDISDAYIALVDTALFDAVYVYRAVDGSLVRCISNDPSIQSLSENSTQDALDETQSASSSRAEREIGVLGVSSIDFRSRKLAVADHTHSIRIYGESNAYMRPLAALAHPQTVFGPTKVGPDEILLFREYSTRLEGDDVHAFQARSLSPGEKFKPSLLGNISQDDSNLSLIKYMKFSYDAKFIATVCATSPAVVWIWNLENVENSRLHALIELMHPVQQVAWSPQTNTVALICNSKVIYMWESRGCAAVQVPGGSSRPGRIFWDQSGSSLIVSSRPTMPIESEMFCFCTISGNQ